MLAFAERRMSGISKCQVSRLCEEIDGKSLPSGLTLR
jgi:hypothetical protein